MKVEDEAEAVADEFMDLDTPAEGAEAVNLIRLLSTVSLYFMCGNRKYA